MGSAHVQHHSREKQFFVNALVQLSSSTEQYGENSVWLFESK